MRISAPKLKAIIKYLCENTDPKLLGKTKLMKLFYYIDFTHIKKYGTSITGDKYYHLERGPIPSVIKNLIDGAEEEPDLAILSDTIQITKKADSNLCQISCLQDFTKKDEEYFSEIELETMKVVTEKFGSYSTKQIVDLAHSEAPWLKTKEVEAIPYTLATEDIDCKVSKEDIELLNKII